VADRFGFNPKKSGPDHAVPVIFRAMAESVAGILPGEATIEHQHVIGSTLPLPDQPGSGFSSGRGGVLAAPV
jgi:hypothetical protein